MIVAEDGASGENGPYVTLSTAGLFKAKTYRLLPHNIRTLEDVRAVFEVLGIRFTCWDNESDPAKKHPHLFTEET